ncbi:class I SAM-dependent methyltransferase [Aminobacter sp. SR38]|jgi:cyclopropane fatty-acyl-phospholipid synthase-like methyltransferase|uniref:class I SAM-dependent methyltransferase n=1 Tax=Aminobacter sp. SR38 TaxID=2774562 RepID=UPI00177BD129|nr:methyltransferase domain-containing protein [Aminobacter sp. SR38]QOF72157.1 class I SAM-dependent methyltransferase [Aminobacter sp. SR38]
MREAKDQETIRFYSNEAETYTARGQPASRHRLHDFMARLPAGGRVLELGCGAGQDSEAMLAEGFDVTPSDGTEAIAAAAARRLGRTVKVLLFDDIDEIDAYDGVWANACLLHVPREHLPAIISRVQRALVRGGVFYASFKAGEAEGRDRFGRYYNYPSPEWLAGAYGDRGWNGQIEITSRRGSGYDRQPTDWLHVFATKA